MNTEAAPITEYLAITNATFYFNSNRETLTTMSFEVWFKKLHRYNYIHVERNREWYISI